MKKKNLVCSLSLSLLFFPVLILFTTQCQNEPREGQIETSRSADFGELVETQREEKIYWTGTIDEDFDGYSVLVVLDKNTGGVNKRHEKSFFGGIEIESIEDLTYFTIDADEINKLGINWEIWRQILWIKLPGDSKENVLSVIRQLEKINGIKSVSPGHYEQPCAVPNDLDYGSQWGLGAAGIQASAAWDIIIGSAYFENLKVGIIDSGIANHLDLNENLIAGWDFYNNNSVTNDDPIGHGTHVAGIVGAVGNNSRGVSGVCWNVTLVPLQVVIPSTGKLHVPAVTAAIHYATQNHIPILNYSGGGTSNNSAREDAIRQYPGLFVCSAGNDGNNNNNSATPYYPANHDLKNLIAVGSIDRNGNKSSFSNFGATKVDLFAPGGAGPGYPDSEQILSTVPGGYDYKSGTSMAAPHVTGVAALVLSLHPGMTGVQLKTVLRNSVDRNSNLIGKCITGGIINAYKAVNYIPIIGSMNIILNFIGYSPIQGTPFNSTIIVGKFYFFTNGSWTVIDRGILSTPVTGYYPPSSSERWLYNPVPAGILTYMLQNGIGSINAFFDLSVPVWNGGEGRYWTKPFNMTISSSGTQIYNSSTNYRPGEFLAASDKRKIRTSNHTGSVW